MGDDLEALRSAVAATARQDLSPLDGSYGSIDRLEDYFRLVLEGSLTGDERLPSQIARYVGATLIEHAGGRWATERDREVVVDIPHRPRGTFDPLSEVLTFERLGTAGLLRDATEAWDATQRRADLAEATRDVPGAIDALRADLRAVLGRDPGAMDGSVRSLAALEEGLGALIASHAPRAQKRLLRGHAIVFLGQLLHDELGRGEWSVCEEPRHADLGQFRMAGWAPWDGMRAIGPRSKPGQLRANLRAAVAGRKKAKTPR